MKTLLNYKYNLFPDKIIKSKSDYYFFYAEVKYYVVELNRPIDDLNLLVNVNEKLESFARAVYKILPSLKKEYHFLYEGKNFIVIKVLKNENEIIDLIDLNMFNKLLKTRENTLLNRNDWKKLWEEKIDYFEYGMSMVNETNTLVNGSFSYYVGLAENAISYYNDTILEEPIKENELYISHKRIITPIVSGNIYNPLNFIFDYNVRDTAEYIKTKFFNDKIDWDEIDYIFNKNIYSKFSLRLLYARLLYPSYYFDAYEQYLADKKEEKLKKIISKSKEYEDFLFDIFIYIKKITPIPEIDWIIKNKRV